MGNHHHHHQHSAAEHDGAAMAELLDLEAEVLHSYLSEVTAWIHELTSDLPPRRILDLGSGTGAGILTLLRRFEEADGIALDVDEHMLHRLGGKARDLGMDHRVRTVQADLDVAWPAVGTVELAWASASLHHMADPDRVLTEVFSSLRPGGLLAVLEMDSLPLPRFLPDDLGLGRPGLEARCRALLAETLADRLPHLDSGWGARLAGAGFAVEAERTFAIDLKPPLPASTGRYAQATLRRIRSGLGDRMSADDLATLDILVDDDGPGSVLRRDDLTVRATRTVWMARRP
ncbi:methyltransferase domain-containing protein [Streptosporangium sp. NPDC051023]|uniref:methyltransferase domain-containing protein n=1 Tax=Streptosporangium sp. NPDC051023 TaxID=3155410 RepID=UPI00344EA4AC